MNSKELTEFLGLPQGDFPLLAQAFMHNSAAYERNLDSLFGNERLEFFGDAVLEYVVSHWLYNKYPNYPEGKLTLLRAALVSEKTLSQWALEQNLGRFLVLGKGEEASGGRDKPAILADAFEALIGALALEFGLAKAQEFIIKKFLDNLNPQDLLSSQEGSWKSKLQEMVQGELKLPIPQYKTIKHGPQQDHFFQASVLIGGELKGQGRGNTKKEAEHQAAKKAYAALVKEK